MTNSGGGGIKIDVDYAEYHLSTTPEALALNNDGITYTPIPNMLLNIGRNFSVASGVLKYLNGANKFLINGTSDLEVNLAADITYALVLNGVPVPSELTTVSFAASGKKRNISITAIAVINQDDLIEIWVKGDGTAGVTVTVNKLDVTFVEVA